MTRQLDDILVEWFDIIDRIAALEDAKKKLQSELRDLGTGKHESALGVVSIAPTRRFNDQRARSILTPEQIALCSETVISSAKAKTILAPALYEACMAEMGAARITVKAIS